MGHADIAGFKSSPNKSAPTKDSAVWGMLTLQVLKARRINRLLPKIALCGHADFAGFKSSPNKSAPTKDSAVWGMLTLQALKARRINRLLPKIALCGAC
ncbi:hypothetical protein D0N37_16345 [Pseudoalteromonas piscicida]|nr:hypothetical protein D0N37_16345 [Pseudoalteromonas piscicida]